MPLHSGPRSDLSPTSVRSQWLRHTCEPLAQYIQYPPSGAEPSQTRDTASSPQPEVKQPVDLALHASVGRSFRETSIVAHIPSVDSFTPGNVTADNHLG